MSTKINKVVPMVMAASLWLLMMTDYRKTARNINGAYLESEKGYVSTGLWYKTKQKCEAAAGKDDIKSGANLCVKSTPTQ